MLMTYSAPISSNGRVVVPKPVREKLRLEDGEELVFTETEDGRFTISTPELALRRLQTLFKQHCPDYTLDDFLGEKREEARRENNED